MSTSISPLKAHTSHGKPARAFLDENLYNFQQRKLNVFKHCFSLDFYTRRIATIRGRVLKDTCLHCTRNLRFTSVEHGLYYQAVGYFQTAMATFRSLMLGWPASSNADIYDYRSNRTKRFVAHHAKAKNKLQNRKDDRMN